MQSNQYEHILFLCSIRNYSLTPQVAQRFMGIFQNFSFFNQFENVFKCHIAVFLFTYKKMLCVYVYMCKADQQNENFLFFCFEAHCQYTVYLKTENQFFIFVSEKRRKERQSRYLQIKLLVCVICNLAYVNQKISLFFR